MQKYSYMTSIPRTRDEAFQLIADELEKLRCKEEVSYGNEGSLLNICWQNLVENFFDNVSVTDAYKQPSEDVKNVFQTCEDVLIMMGNTRSKRVFTAKVVQRLPETDPNIMTWFRQEEGPLARRIYRYPQNVILLKMTDLFFKNGKNFTERTLGSSRNNDRLTGFVLYDATTDNWFVESSNEGQSTWHGDDNFSNRNKVIPIQSEQV